MHVEGREGKIRSGGERWGAGKRERQTRVVYICVYVYYLFIVSLNKEINMLPMNIYILFFF
jgi:hypothetical protein